MRTVDPELWSKKAKTREIQVTRRMRFGQRAGGRLEERLRASLQDAAAEFWQNCSIPTVKYINASRSRHERYLYVALMLVTLSVAVSMVLDSNRQVHARPPLIVSLQSTQYSVTNFKFPAVAVCSNKIISRAALKNYTQYLYTHPKNKKYRYRRGDIENYLLNMGALLTMALPPLKLNLEGYIREVESQYNVTDIMFKLSANCSSILLRCSWRGQLEHCGSLFGTRLTALGFCCVFNSRFQPVDFHREPLVLDLIGADYGLGFVVRESRDDFAYVRRPAYGMEMMIFAGDEYPLLESGDVRLYPLPRNATLFYNVHAIMQYPAENIRDYSEDWRGCRLQGPGRSQCLAGCRRGSARALCGCVPLAWQPQAEAPRAPLCTPGELACLNKHREKFMYLHPGDDAGLELSQELQDALNCPACRVLCKRQLYSARISRSMHWPNMSIFRDFLTENISLVNTTVIRVFYNVDHQEWYTVEAFTRWYEVTLKISTHWVVVTGVSVLTCTELVFHGTFRWVHHFIRRTRIANMRPAATSTYPLEN